MESYIQKSESGPQSYTIQKINTKWIKDSNIRPKHIKFLEENIVSKLLDIALSDNFLDLTPKAMATKLKMNQWDYIKLKTFCMVKESMNKIKRQSTEWEKIFTSHISKQFSIQRPPSYNSTTQNNLIEKWVEVYKCIQMSNHYVVHLNIM